MFVNDGNKTTTYMKHEHETEWKAVTEETWRMFRVCHRHFETAMMVKFRNYDSIEFGLEEYRPRELNTKYELDLIESITHTGIDVIPTDNPNEYIHVVYSALEKKPGKPLKLKMLVYSNRSKEVDTFDRYNHDGIIEIEIPKEGETTTQEPWTMGSQLRIALENKDGRLYCTYTNVAKER